MTKAITKLTAAAALILWLIVPALGGEVTPQAARPVSITKETA